MGKTRPLILRMGDTDVTDTYLDHDSITSGGYEPSTPSPNSTPVLTPTGSSQAKSRSTVSSSLTGTKPPGVTSSSPAKTTASYRAVEVWVKNSDRWALTQAHDDGFLTDRRAHSK